MSLKNLFGNAAGKALLISLAGALAIGGLPVKAAGAATLADLYLTDMVIRNCTIAFDEDNTTHDGEDETYDPDMDGENFSVAVHRASRVTRAIEEAVTFQSPDDADFEAIFNPINQQISQDIENFCVVNIPLAQEVIGDL